MHKRPGRPKKALDDRYLSYQPIRCTPAEKAAFRDAAAYAGMAVTTWIRERLRRAAQQELTAAGQPVAFLPQEGVARGKH